MKKIFFIALAFLYSIAIEALAETPREIVNKAENIYKGETSVGTFKMIIVTPDYTRKLRMKAWNDGHEKALIKTLAPKKERGNKLLKIGNELWNYLKNTETTMKLPSSMMLQSWNGSDLTYDDLVRESDMAEDYEISKLKEEKIAGETCWKFKLKPKPDAAVVWSKIYYWVRKKDNLPAYMQFFNERGEKVRTIKFTDIKMMDGRKLPTVWTVIDDTKEGNHTKFIYEEVDFNVDIPDRIFSFRQLER